MGDLDEEEGYQPDVSRAGPELDVQDVLQKVLPRFLKQWILCLMIWNERCPEKIFG